MIERMIGRLTGQFGGTTVDGLVLIDVAGVGYVVRTPALFSTAAPGTPLSLYIHTAVREDAIDLYGFQTEAELAFFKQLMSVSGIGPKTALGIMGTSDTLSLKRAVAKGDATTLTKVFGIGKKNAERMVVELRDKITTEIGSDAALGGMLSEDNETMEALMALGYRAEEAREALKCIGPETVGTRQRVAAALKHLGSPAQTLA